MSDDSLPEVSHLGLDELLALRCVIDARLEEKRTALLEQAQRLGAVIGNGTNKRRGRTPKTEATS